MYYQKHVFICTNQREAGGKKCCANAGAAALVSYAKAKIKALGQNGQGKIRVNNSGCLGRCEEGPTLVVYPEGVWYTYHSQADVDEIINEHVLQGRIVERLLMPQA